MEFNLFLPQMRLSFDQIVERAQAAEAAGFVGMTGMDHLAPPMAEDQPMYEAMVTNTWIAAHTSTLMVGSLVLCDAFRHPATLAREAVSIDHASGGRFELGIGWGSVPTEFSVYGVGSTAPRDRVERLRETLDVLKAFWAGETLDYDGEFHHMTGARQQPVPLGHIPIVIGGVGKKTLALVREHADWWNVHVGEMHRVPELRDQVGDARVSVQKMVAYVPDEASRAAITETAQRRFGSSAPVIGTGPEIVDYFGGLAEQGVERVYVWFCDFASPESIDGFGREVLRPLQGV
ncbi:MAG: LLM class flavin-dependent oxidoreductase [Actinobacteria bacterium]|nr:LLM class flavin-dependent oxidoreductase [Actinomycetota bacterium]